MPVCPALGLSGTCRTPHPRGRACSIHLRRYRLFGQDCALGGVVGQLLAFGAGGLFGQKGFNLFNQLTSRPFGGNHPGGVELVEALL